MRNLSRHPLSLILGIIATFIIIPRANCQSSGIETALIQDPNVKKIVQAINEKLAPIKGYTAQLESSSLDPNGGFANFSVDVSFCRPDKMNVKRTALVIHDPHSIGMVTTIVIDGAWSSSRMDRPTSVTQRKIMEEMLKKQSAQPGARKMTQQEMDAAIAPMLNHEKSSSYSKINLKALEKAGGPTVREYISSMNNLLDPFVTYNMATLKLERETPTEWVILGEFKNKIQDWPSNRLIIDKKTGFLKKVEADFKEMGQTVILLDVKKVTPLDRFSNNLFKMEFPASAYVSDNTDDYIMSIEMQKEREKNQR